MAKTVEQEMVLKYEEANNKQSWDGKKRHLEERCSNKTRQWLEIIIRIIREIIGVEEPIWNPRDYVAYKINNRIWLAIATHKNMLLLDFVSPADFFSAQQIAERLGIPSLDKKSSNSDEKGTRKSSVSIENTGPTKNRVLLRIEEDFDLEQEEFKKFLIEAYKAFKRMG